MMGELRLPLRMVDAHSDIRITSLMSRRRTHRSDCSHVLGRVVAVLVMRLPVGSY